MTHRLSLALVLCLATSAVPAEDWPCWRGPRLDGSSLDKNLPTTWSATENIVWKCPLPGIGHSSAAIVGDRVFLTVCMLKEESRVLMCIDRNDGKVIWQKEIFKAPLEPKHGLNSYASATPTTDGKHVWVAFARLRAKEKGDDYPRKPRSTGYLDKKYPGMVEEMVVACYTCDGDKVWEKTPGQFYSTHGFCTSPIPYKDTIILNGDQDAEAYIVALDKLTGSEKWRINRENRIRSYCAPLIVEAAGKMQMVLTGAMTVASYDPDSGKQLWLINGPTEQFVASPVFTQNLFFITTGFPEYHNMAIKPDGEGNITKTHVAWHEKVNNLKASYVPSPLAYDKWFYVISDTGRLTCFDAKTGERKYMETLGRHHSASPVLANGHLYITDDDGITYIVKGGEKFDVVAQNALGDKCYSSAAIADGKLFIRTDRWLFCIGKK